MVLRTEIVGPAVFIGLMLILPNGDIICICVDELMLFLFECFETVD